LRLKLFLDPKSGFSRHDAISVQRMMDFYRTQDLSEHFSERTDLLEIKDLVMQYDPYRDAILICDKRLRGIRMLSEMPQSILPMPPPGSRRLWKEPATGTIGSVDTESESDTDENADEDEGKLWEW
jgi:hypothetical protein